MHSTYQKMCNFVITTFSAQIGAALQRYPYVRLFALLYMVCITCNLTVRLFGVYMTCAHPCYLSQVLLHVWVMVVLFTYKPEVHSDLWYSRPICSVLQLYMCCVYEFMCFEIYSFIVYDPTETHFLTHPLDTRHVNAIYMKRGRALPSIYAHNYEHHPHY